MQAGVVVWERLNGGRGNGGRGGRGGRLHGGSVVGLDNFRGSSHLSRFELAVFVAVEALTLCLLLLATYSTRQSTR